MRAAALLGAAVLTLGVAGAATAPSPFSMTTTAERDAAYQLGLEAYVYGLPLVTTDATFRTMTSVTASQGAFGPVNRFNHDRGSNGASSTAVVAPGATSLSSIAWLDLSAEPQVITIPPIAGRGWMLALIDPYTENVRMLSSAVPTAPGEYVIAGPGQGDAAIPSGAQRVDVDQDRVWVIGSIELRGPDDAAAVNQIQDGFSITPLSHAGTTWQAPVASPAVTTVTQATIPTGVAWFDALGDLLARFPPPAADEPELARLAQVGIGPGRHPSTDPSLGTEALRGLADAVADGPKQLTEDTGQLVATSAKVHDGYLLGGFGRYGTDYAERAVITEIGLGAVVPEQAVYAMAWNDAAGVALDGSSSYVLHLPGPPPGREGWSLTVYDLHGALVANPLDRYAFTNHAALTTNADGSVDLLLGPTQPADAAQAANWLPTPSGEGFEVAWRVFAPDPAALPGILDGTGWQPLAVTPAG
ncbi:MAG: DUF1254 domain-containing protein [Chloroflexota bacterium]